METVQYPPKLEIYPEEGESGISLERLTEEIISHLDEYRNMYSPWVRIGALLSYGGNVPDRKLTAYLLNVICAVLRRTKNDMSVLEETLFDDRWKAGHDGLMKTMVVGPMLSRKYGEDGSFRTEENVEILRRWFGNVRNEGMNVIGVTI